MLFSIARFFILRIMALSSTLLILSACASSPPNAAAAKEYFSIALLYENQKDTAHAVEMYKKALQIDPSMRMARHNLAQVYIVRAEYDNARALLDGLVAEDPSNQAVAETIAYLAAKQGKLEDALNAYKQILSVTEGRAAVLYNLALISRELGKMDDAYAYANRLVLLVPEEPAYTRLAGLIALKLDKQEDAERNVSRFTRSMEKDAAALVSFSQDLEDQAYHARALEVLDKALVADGKNMPAMLLKIKILANGANDPERAQVAMRKLMEIGGVDDAALIALMRALPEKQRQPNLDIIHEFKKDFGKDISFDAPPTTTTTLPPGGTTTTTNLGATLPIGATTPTTVAGANAPATTTTIKR